MTQTLTAHFDGKVIVPDEPVQLPIGHPLRVVVEAGPPAMSGDGSGAARALPVWEGEVIGSLTRGEIYGAAD